MKQFGRYQVIGELGAGGMARVYRAHDPRLRREVAVKVISTFVSDRDKSRERFEQEAAVMAQLAHPGIVPIYDFGEQDGYPYIVMRLMRGGSLANRLKQKAPLSLSEVTGLFEQLAPALEMAHTQGIVHRDLKPDNILFDQSGNLSIADFGLVKLLSASIPLSRTGPMRGSPPYMSPEQALGASGLNQQSDIYSLGAILFEALTGRWPYLADHPLGFAMQHNNGAIPNICEINPNLPTGCKEIIDCVLAKTPSERYASVTKLVEALKALQLVDTPTSPPPNPVEYLTRGHEYYNQRQYDLAISQYNEAVRLRPNDANTLLSRGNGYYNKREYDLAIADYTETLRIQPHYATAYYNRGNAYQYKRQFELALADYDQALRINPNNVTALFQRGNVYYKQGQLDKAIADYDEALRVNPNYAQVAQKRQEAVQKRQEAAQEAIKKQQEAIRKQQEEEEARAREKAAQEAAALQKRRQQEAEAREKAAQEAAALQKRRQQEKEARARQKAAQEAAALQKRRQQEAEARAREKAAQKAAAAKKARAEEQARAAKKAAQAKKMPSQPLRAAPRTVLVTPQVEKRQELPKEVANALATMRDYNLPPTERAKAGRKLAELGDPRPEVMTVDGMEFCYVPRGPFWMGAEAKSKWFSFLQDDSKPPLHQIDIPYDYWIARYPVTNAQYQEFVDDGGYRYQPFWAEAKAHRHWQSGKIRSRDRPRGYGTPYNLPNHPVVGVTWYEALAFTRWLSKRWLSTSAMRLPTEGEWEKAARGGIEIPVTALIRLVTNLDVPASFTTTQNLLPQRYYPWGNNFDSTSVNSQENGIGYTNAVGCFVKAQSPYNLEEMSGNVWEWCQCLYKDDPYRPDDGRQNLAVDTYRVLRGGSYYDQKRKNTVFYRYRLDSKVHNKGGGFRVVRPYNL